MTLLPTIITAEQLAARAQSDADSMPTVHLDTHVPGDADRVASQLRPRRDHFRLPESSLSDITRSGSRSGRPTGPRPHEVASGALSFDGFHHVTTHHGFERDHQLVADFSVGASTPPEMPATQGSHRRQDRIADFLSQANNLMSGAELDTHLAHRPGVSPEHRAEILERARECYARAGRLVHRAEALARAGRIPAELRADVTVARLRVDTAGFSMGA